MVSFLKINIQNHFKPQTIKRNAHFTSCTISCKDTITLIKDCRYLRNKLDRVYILGECFLLTRTRNEFNISFKLVCRVFHVQSFNIVLCNTTSQLIILLHNTKTANIYEHIDFYGLIDKY